MDSQVPSSTCPLELKLEPCGRSSPSKCFPLRVETHTCVEFHGPSLLLHPFVALE